MTFLINVLYQIISIFGIVYIVGLFINLCRKLVYKFSGKNSYKAIKYMGIIGTPIHEIGHAIFCVIFLHKIDEIKLFTPNNENSLGYVSHRYNKKNPYQQIGNFFIGIGPIIFGTVILGLLMYLLIPNVFNTYINNFSSLKSLDLKNMFNESIEGIKSLFTGNFKNPYWYFFIFISFFIVTHMVLSPDDIKGSLKGVFYLLILLLLIDCIIYLISQNIFETFTYYICVAGQYIFYFLLISCVLSLFLVVFSFLVIKLPSLIFKLFRKKS